MADISQKIIEILSEQSKKDITEINLDSDLEKDLGLDSLDITEVTMEIEEFYGLPEIDFEEIYQLGLENKGIGSEEISSKPVSKLVDYVQQKLNNQ